MFFIYVLCKFVLLNSIFLQAKFKIMTSTKEVIKQSSNIEIRQDNAITTARYDYSACQLDILFYLLSKLKKDDDMSTTYFIYVTEIESMTGRKWNYQQLREATEDLGSRMFEVESDKSYKQLWIFQKVEYIKGHGCLEIALSQYIRPYLFDLKNNFTSYQLHSVLKLTSKYAKRIYAICSQWKDLGESKQFDIDDLKYILKIKDPSGKESEQFKQISQFKQYVLDIAVKQINEHTELTIEYVIGKIGRTSKNIKFKIKRNQIIQTPIPFDVDPIDIRSSQVKEILESFAIKDVELVNTILRDNKLVDGVFKFNYDLKTGKIKSDKNPAGLLLTVLGLKKAKNIAPKTF
jgi:hypothetical protein